jgi:glutamate dehydrogenase
VHANNVARLLERDGTPRFRFIVEGANLFFTQDARLQLERAGVVIFKDASANKGGVTSSSLEVLAALALSDDEYATHMQVAAPGATPPDFYQRYVREVQARIEHNARLEFECLWREHERTRIPRCVLTDKISEKINSLDSFVGQALWDIEPVRRRVLEEALPKLLLELVGLDNILRRVPEPYLRAIIGSYIASHYVYQYGLAANEFAFFEFMQKYLKLQS